MPRVNSNVFDDAADRSDRDTSIKGLEVTEHFDDPAKHGFAGGRKAGLMVRLIASFRRRLEVRVIRATATGFRPGDYVVVNAPNYMAHEHAVWLNNALQRRFPEVRFQLISGSSYGFTVLQHPGCHNRCDCTDRRASNTDDKCPSGEAPHADASELGSRPEAQRHRDRLPDLVLFADVSPEQGGDPVEQTTGHGASGKLADANGGAGFKTVAHGAPHAE